jgi:hypothetical protein
MENMFSKMSRSVQARHAFLSHAYQNMTQSDKTTMKAVAVGAVVMVTPQLAFAANGADFFCYIAEYFKSIVGGAALVALLMWAIEHIFGVAKLHDVVIKVGIAAAIVIGATTIIAKSGLTPPGCSILSGI